MIGTAIAEIRAADKVLNASDPSPFPLPVVGLENVIAGSILGLEQGDWWVPGMRERIGAVLRKVPVERLVDGMAGAKPYRVAPPTPSPALRALHAVGLALADPDRAVLVHLGIGSASDGAFYEALNLAALTQAKVVFVLAVHPLGEGSPLGRQLAADPATLGQAFSIPTHIVDGNEGESVLNAVRTARNADGPHLVICQL